MEETSQKVLKELIATRNSIKNKYLELKRGLFNVGVASEEIFKPVTQPLNKLTEQLQPLPQGGKKRKSTPTRLVFKEEVESPMKSQLKFARVKQLQTEEGNSNSSDADVESFDEGEYVYSYDSPKPVQRENTEIFQEALGHIAGKYMKYYQGEEIKITDNVFGIFLEENEQGVPIFKIGNKQIDVHLNDILIDGHEYQGTEGLFELLVKKEPDMRLVTKDDMKTYRNILKQTSAHLRGNTPEGERKVDKGFKYRNVIRKLFPPIKNMITRSNANKKTGSGLTYWHNPNTLVERLMLLNASKAAGHRGHENEILDILNALRQAELIE